MVKRLAVKSRNAKTMGARESDTERVRVLSDGGVGLPHLRVADDDMIPDVAARLGELLVDHLRKTSAENTRIEVDAAQYGWIEAGGRNARGASPKLGP